VATKRELEARIEKLERELELLKMTRPNVVIQPTPSWDPLAPRVWCDSSPAMMGTFSAG
jgi:hypothetical protein